MYRTTIEATDDGVIVSREFSSNPELVEYKRVDSASANTEHGQRICDCANLEWFFVTDLTFFLSKGVENEVALETT